MQKKAGNVELEAAEKMEAKDVKMKYANDREKHTHKNKDHR